jgi:predicted HTH domain antitoxin
MTAQTIVLDDDVVEVLVTLDQPIDRSVREFVVLELYRRGTISGGKAATLLDMSLLDFIRYSGSLGIPYFDLDEGELEEEVRWLQRR